MREIVKWKLITGVSLIITIILCMMTIYTQRQYNYVQMVNERTESDMIDLKTDYENLYDAYYGYDKKILKLLEGNENVFWAEDSSAYVVMSKDEVLFSFYKKPKMNGEFFLYQFGSVERYYGHANRIDDLKPHEFKKLYLTFRSPEDGSFKKFKGLFVARSYDSKHDNDSPDTSSTILKIYYP